MASATAGPERSCFSPRAQESLTVSTAAVNGSTVEEDIFFGIPFGLPGIALRFIEQAQPFHQQALGIQLGALFGGLPVEVHLEVAVGPAQDFENGLVADERTVNGVLN